MRLLLVQLLVIVICLPDSRQENRRRKARLLSYQEQVRLGSKDSQGLGVLGVESAFKAMLEQAGPVPALAPELGEPPHSTSSQKAGERRQPRLSLPAIELHLDDSQAAWSIPDHGNFPPEALRGFIPPQLSDARNQEPANRRHAKKFWNHFLLRKNSASEDLVLPERTDEHGQESCRPLPFTQSIIHENCQKAVVENNLCFGKCSSFHVPGPADHLYTFCSHCLPSKFTMRHLQMNCTGATALVKAVMVVEECHCEVQRSKHPQHTLFKASLDSDLPSK